MDRKRQQKCKLSEKIKEANSKMKKGIEEAGRDKGKKLWKYIYI